MSTFLGKGQLRHFFHGEHSAAIAIAFESPLRAAVALRVLGTPWQLHDKSRRAVFAVVTGAELERQVEVLASFGADREKIASLRKSVDYGEPFEVEIPLEFSGEPERLAALARKVEG